MGWYFSWLKRNFCAKHLILEDEVWQHLIFINIHDALFFEQANNEPHFSMSDFQ